VQWGREALGSADADWALALWAAAANARPGPGEHLHLLPQLFEAMGANKPPEQADASLQVLAQLVPRLSSDDDRHAVQAKIAAIRLERGEFQAAIEELDRAGSGYETMAAGFTRALALIRLDKSDEALAALEKMEKMPGSDEERARAAFLIGWIHLRADDRPKASAAFERVVDRYPRSTSAKKAKELLPTLQAGLP
jgi:tetratricopeptide (TPR) repeat protein